MKDEIDARNQFARYVRMACPIMWPVPGLKGKPILRWERHQGKRNMLKEFFFGEPLRFGWYWIPKTIGVKET